MRYLDLLVCSLLICFCLGACLPTRTPLPPLPTSTPLPPSHTASPTIVWFPATFTCTPLPVSTADHTATPDLSPQNGEILFSDAFDGASQWTLGRQAAGNIALGVKELTLAVNQPRSYLFSLLHGVSVSDFYLEITASPSLCREADEYGLLLRISPSGDFLRFGLLCNGQARLDRYSNSQASSPIPPTTNGVIPPGAPSLTRLGVWARGKNLQFYANGQHLFSASESLLLSGSLGVFTRSVSSNALTVNFSDLVIYASEP